MDNPTRDGEATPETRGGVALTSGTALGGTSLERNAPRFQNQKEFMQWLNGKPTRHELRDDFARQQKGLALLTALNSEIDSKFEALVRLLCEKGIIDKQTFLDRSKLQLDFKRMLDGLNFASGDMSMKDKLAMVLDWNETHPELLAHGAYVRGAVEYLRINPEGDTPERLAEIASSLMLDPTEVLNDATMEALAVTPEEAAQMDAEIKAAAEKAQEAAHATEA